MELITPGLGLLVWTTVIFLSVLFVLSKFAWRPIVTALKEREDFIENALNSAEKAKSEMAQLKADNDMLLQEARLERDKIIKEAQITSTTLINEAKEKAQSEANRLVESARMQINNEKNAALTEIKNVVAETSVNIAEMILKKNLSNDASQKELVSQYLNESKFN
ncbi:MAG: F0F1 ATP synthase subunit B [Cytophagales bacterium]